jgi:protein ImuB
MILCVHLVSVDEPGEAVMAALLDAAPRVVIELPCVWLDVRGLDVAAVQSRLRRRLRTASVRARFGASWKPLVARVAAQTALPDDLIIVARGEERAYLAAHPLTAIGVQDPLLGWLADVGLTQCGELAAVASEAVEVRFGADAVRWWRLARADDERRLFNPVPAELPNASVDFIDYVVTDPERLIFTTNALLGGLCDQMRESGSHAKRLRLRLPLANGDTWERTLRTARPTADRAAWLRLARMLLEKLTVPDAVAGVSVAVEATEEAGSVQGDLFDAGFATASAVEVAVVRLIEDQGDVMRVPVAGEHPLAEQRGVYRPLEVHEAIATAAPAAVADVSEPLGLTLQLLAEPRAITVETARRRDHEMPVRYRDSRWHSITTAAGPDRVSGGQWDDGYAREYFRAVNDDGTLIWIFRDGVFDKWYLHGYWD